MRVEIRAIRHLLIGAAALFLVTGAAHAEPNALGCLHEHTTRRT
jgi:hypothetical protein